MTQQTITPELHKWILDQASAGQPADSVLAAMVSSGWEEEVALTALEEVMKTRFTELGLPPNSAVPEPFLDDAQADASKLWAHDKWVKVLVQSRHPRIVVFGDFMSAEECQGLIELAKPKLDRSQTVVHATGDSEVNEARTSRGMFFTRAENALCERIEARIAALTNWPVERGEGLQVLHYLPGAEYKPHFDYFDPLQSGTPTILKRGGQRVGTLVIYLNTPEAGGATVFPDAGLDVHAVTGNAVFFSYSIPHPTTKTLHGGSPVRAGEKWVATKWMRASTFV